MSLGDWIDAHGLSCATCGRDTAADGVCHDGRLYLRPLLAVTTGAADPVGGGVIWPERDRHWPIPLSAVSSIPCMYGERFVVAHAAKELPGGTFSPVGVALAKAVVDANIRSSSDAQGGSFPSTRSGPGGAETPRGPDTTCQEVMP